MPGGRPLSPRTLPKKVRANTAASKAELRNPVFPGKYIYVGDPLATGFTGTPDWENDFFYFGTAYVGFRHGLDGGLEFVGRLDLSLGAVTGTVAFTVPAPYRNQTFEFTFPVFVSGTDWATGTFAVDGSNGECTVYWPTVADPI